MQYLPGWTVQCINPECLARGHWLRIDRAGYTGDLGYELWVEPKDAIWLWETLFRLGEPWKIAPIGSRALDMSRIEAGFILVDVDYIGAMHAVRLSQRQSPIEAVSDSTIASERESAIAFSMSFSRRVRARSVSSSVTGSRANPSSVASSASRAGSRGMPRRTPAPKYA